MAAIAVRMARLEPDFIVMMYLIKGVLSLLFSCVPVVLPTELLFKQQHLNHEILELWNTYRTLWTGSLMTNQQPVGLFRKALEED